MCQIRNKRIDREKVSFLTSPYRGPPREIIVSDSSSTKCGSGSNAFSDNHIAKTRTAKT